MVSMEDYDIIGVTESWIDTSNRDFLAEYSIQGYTLFSCEREHREGGGVLIYVKTNLHPFAKPVKKMNNIDVTFIQLNTKVRKLVIGVIYRPPRQIRETDDKLYEQIAEICSENDTLIVGDFNLAINRWGDPLNSHSGHDLYNNLLESSLHQLVAHPTRGDNILDLIFTTNENIITNVEVGSEFSNSDHRVITFGIKTTKSLLNESKEKVPDYRRANFVKLKKILAESDWSQLSGPVCINEAWKAFRYKLDLAVNSSVPMRNRRAIVNNKPKWWTPEVKTCLIAKKRAYHKYKVTQNERDKAEHDKLRRSAKKCIRESKKNYELHVANQIKSNPKEFYNYVRSKKVLASTIGPLALPDGEYTDNETKMACELNDYFASVFTKESVSEIQPIVQNYSNNKFLSRSDIKEKEILLAINKIKISKTPGPDKISPRILKEAKNELVKPLSILFNKSLTTHKVPDDWKLANVTPIFKKGDKSQPKNYRPISLTSVVGKLMETVLRDKIVTFLENNNLIKDSQHGFRNKRSCLTNLLDFFHDVYNLYDNTRAVDIIYLDFQKAFDKVPHKRLINKVKAYGLNGDIAAWIEDWLSNRKQRVVINGKSSDWINVNSGVPQGSVLGPILFIIYINDIDEGIKCKISKFADDTKIANKVDSENERQLLQSDLNTLIEWSNKWQMKFNIDKCHVLHIGNQNPKATFSINNIPMTSVDKEKDLGIIVSTDLKPSKHCTEVVKIANKLVGFIGRSFTFKSEKIILTLYNSLVRPHLEYNVPFWSPYYKKDIEKLEKIQRRLTKLIPRLRNKSYDERLKELNLFTLEKRRIRGDLITLFKIFNGFTNLNIEKYLTVDRSHVTRNNGFKIVGNRFRTNEAKHFFFNRIVNIWNGLPANVVQSGTIETFKVRLDKYFESNPRLSLFTPE